MLRPTATIELIYTDSSGNTSATALNVPISSTIAVLDAQASALASLIAPMTDAVLTKIRYTFKATLDGDISDAGSNPIAVAGMFFFDCGESELLEVINIPSISSYLLVHTGPTSEYGIDTTASEVIAFVDALIAMNAVNPLGDMIVSLDTAYRQSRV